MTGATRPSYAPLQQRATGRRYQLLLAIILVRVILCLLETGRKWRSDIADALYLSINAAARMRVRTRARGRGTGCARIEVESPEARAVAAARVARTKQSDRLSERPGI